MGISMNYRFVVLLVFLAMSGLGCAAFPRHSSVLPSQKSSVSEAVSGLVGVVTDITSLRQFTLVLPDGSGEIISYTKEQDAGLSRLALGLLLKVDGFRDRASRVIAASDVTIVQSTGIYVTSPSVGATVTSPLIAFGFARTETGTIEWRLRDHTGASVLHGTALVHLITSTGFGPFRLEIFPTVFKDRNFNLELFLRGRDDIEQESVAIPLTLLSSEGVSFNIYLRNNKKGSSRDCSIVMPVLRTIAKTSAINRAALLELLRGANPGERKDGYVSAIPAGTELRSLSVDGHVALADFSAKLGAVTNACDRNATRAQIVQTLIQFPSIEAVTVGVDGKFDEEKP